jgi:hypothetical protein
MRQPIMRWILDTEPIVIARSAMPGSEAGWMVTPPSYTMPSKTAS